MRVMSRRHGFTLIELLVVIAIIAILAAMLFPVFARARESARKIQCLSNVKNIATAVQMYLTDYDRFPPSEHRPEITGYFDANNPNCDKDRMSSTNPYLKWPVIFDEYVKNRDVWRCPNARFIDIWDIVGSSSRDANGDWWGAVKAHMGDCPGFMGCSQTFPPGWGGTATDFVAQGCAGQSSSDAGGFEMTIGSQPSWAYDMKTSQMEDPTKYPVAYDAGYRYCIGAVTTNAIAYPDTCRIDHVACSGLWCGGDWTNCSWVAYCSAEKGDVRWGTDPTFRMNNAKPRHLGGSNIGFADGHATWMPSETILFGGENRSGYAANPDNPLLLGIDTCIEPVAEGGPR